MRTMVSQFARPMGMWGWEADPESHQDGRQPAPGYHGGNGPLISAGGRAPGPRPQARRVGETTRAPAGPGPSVRERGAIRRPLLREVHVVEGPQARQGDRHLLGALGYLERGPDGLRI